MSAVDINLISHRLQLFIELPLSVVSDVKRPRFYFAAEKYRPKLRPEAQSRPITKAGTCCQHSVVQYGRLLRVAWRVDCKNIRWEPDPQQFL